MRPVGAGSRAGADHSDGCGRRRHPSGGVVRASADRASRERADGVARDSSPPWCSRLSTSPEVAALLPRLLTDAAAGNYQGLFALAFSRDSAEGRDERRHVPVDRVRRRPARITPDDIARETAERFIGTTMFDTQMQAVRVLAARIGAGRLLRTSRLGSAGADLLRRRRSRHAAVLGRAGRVAPSAFEHFVVPGAGHITFMRGCVPEMVATIPGERARRRPRRHAA